MDKTSIPFLLGVRPGENLRGSHAAVELGARFMCRQRLRMRVLEVLANYFVGERLRRVNPAGRAKSSSPQGMGDFSSINNQLLQKCLQT